MDGQLIILSSSNGSNSPFHNNSYFYFLYLLNFRIEGLVLGGLALSPVKHLRLAEPSNDREEDYNQLQRIVDFVSIQF